MVGAVNIALSGLTAASKRVATSANNIANQFSTTTTLNGQVSNQPYTPQRVQQTSFSTGGVTATTADAANPTFKLYDPANPQANAEGLVEYPNVDPAQELVNILVASYDFKANLKTIQTENNMQQRLLDIFG